MTGIRHWQSWDVQLRSETCPTPKPGADSDDIGRFSFRHDVSTLDPPDQRRTNPSNQSNSSMLWNRKNKLKISRIGHDRSSHKSDLDTEFRPRLNSNHRQPGSNHPKKIDHSRLKPSSGGQLTKCRKSFDENNRLKPKTRWSLMHKSNSGGTVKIFAQSDGGNKIAKNFRHEFSSRFRSRFKDRSKFKKKSRQIGSSLSAFDLRRKICSGQMVKSKSHHVAKKDQNFNVKNSQSLCDISDDETFFESICSDNSPNRDSKRHSIETHEREQKRFASVGLTGPQHLSVKNPSQWNGERPVKSDSSQTKKPILKRSLDINLLISSGDTTSKPTQRTRKRIEWLESYEHTQTKRMPGSELEGNKRFSGADSFQARKQMSKQADINLVSVSASDKTQSIERIEWSKFNEHSSTTSTKSMPVSTSDKTQSIERIEWSKFNEHSCTTSTKSMPVSASDKTQSIKRIEWSKFKEHSWTTSTKSMPVSTSDKTQSIERIEWSKFKEHSWTTSTKSMPVSASDKTQSIKRIEWTKSTKISPGSESIKSKEDENEEKVLKCFNRLKYIMSKFQGLD